MNANKIFGVFTLLLLTGTGCVYGALEKDYGNSYRQAKAGQILNPAASANQKPVTGMSGQASAAAMDKYTQSFGNQKNGTPQAFAVPVVPTGLAGGQDGYAK